ncbi:Transmembrane protein 19 [Golovinomyces cichoracearum]|uniref:Transmembrane protein 19 n=1 Tax=Golovinomyces cichoracearum TaxID=62708 RepID=A0A420IZZ5_9PEZI|nr:Transmembrane protein 19 [Golovinomyces cichoracearum]
MKPILAVPITLVMVHRAWSKASLTPAGILAAVVTAVAHAIHPWNLPFGLLIVFFLAGTHVTKVIKHDVKSKLTIRASGNTGGEISRTHIQVIANSGVASILSLLHSYQIYRDKNDVLFCLKWPRDLYFLGIVANYAAAAADTFSSELGIISKSQPRLITSMNLRKVPPGTNGGVTAIGLMAGILGSFIIVVTTIVLTPFCQSPILTGGKNDQRVWGFKEKLIFAMVMTLWGALGSVLDSFLGGWLQQSVVDIRSGKIIEGDGGKSILGKETKTGLYPTHAKVNLSRQREARNVSAERHVEIPSSSIGSSEDGNENKILPDLYPTDMKPSISVESGTIGFLDNNQVNFLMTLIMSIGAIVMGSWTLETPQDSLAR